MSKLPQSDTYRTEKIYRKVSLRLIPFLFICYLVAYLDRVNVGFAKLQMLADLKFSDTIYGLGAGIFFLGYFIFEIPSNIIMQRVGPRLWIARIMITWGALSAAMIFVDTPGLFYTLRFFLGVAEAGFFPGIILYLTYWYPEERRGRVVAWFMTAVALSGVVGGPLSGWIMQTFVGVGSLSNWQWLFLLEGLPSILIGIVTFFYLDDGISSAGWLSGEEQTFLQQRIAQDNKQKHDFPLEVLFGNGRIWLFGAIYFSFVMGLYGISFWLPNLLKNTGVKDIFTIGLLSAIPYAAGAIGMVLAGRFSDHTGERHFHIAAYAFAGAAGFLLSTSGQLEFALIGITVATICILASVSIFWSLPTGYLTGTAAAAGIAMINAIGNTAGFVSPYLVGWIKDKTHSLSDGLYVLAASFFIGGFLVLGARRFQSQPRHQP